MKRKVFKLVSLLFASVLLILVGCANNNEFTTPTEQTQETGESIMNTGTLYLMVNPEIAMDYDEIGLVTDVRGTNPDGEEVIEDYTDYIGKESGVVLEELILRIGEAGYFVEEASGDSKRIVIELEAGSALPGDNFLEKMAASAQRAVEDYNTFREESTETAETGQSSEQTEPSESQSAPATVTYEDNTLISMDEAKQIAYDHAGVQANEVVIDDQDLDSDNGVPVYEFDFDVGPNEYEYEIHALTGEVLYFDQDIESTESDTQTDDFISLDEAKQIAFDHAGVDGSQAYFDEEEWDEDDGVPYYSLEFEIGEDEYEYDIHVRTGEILDYDIDLD